MQPRSKYHESTSALNASWEVWTSCTLKFHTVIPHDQYDMAMDSFRDFEEKLQQFIEENKPPLWDDSDLQDNYGMIGGHNEAQEGS